MASLPAPSASSAASLASASASASAPPACRSQAVELGTFLSALAREGVGHGEIVHRSDERFDFRPLPAIALVKVDAHPEPPAFGAVVVLDGGKLKFGDTVAPMSSAARVRRVIELARDSGSSPGFGSGSHGASHFHMAFSFFVGATEKWRDVASAVAAAQTAGFTEVFFELEAKSAVAPPVESPFFAKLRALTTATGKTGFDEAKDLHAAFAEATHGCPALATPFAQVANDTTAEQAQRDAFVAQAAPAFEACGCGVERRDVEAFAWVTFGRHWGPPLTNLAIDIGSTIGAKEKVPTLKRLAASGDLPFSEVVSRLREADPQGQYKLVAE